MQTLTDERRSISACWLRRAEVVRIDVERRRARIRLRIDECTTEELWAMLASVEPSLLRPGGRVVAGCDDEGVWFLLGALDAAVPSPAPTVLAIPGGGRAAIRDGRLQVHSPDRRLLIEYDAATGSTWLHAGDGNLVLSAPQGNIRMEAGRSISLSGGELHAHGRSSAEVSAGHHSAAGGAAVRLEPCRISTEAHTVRVLAQHSVVQTRELERIAKRTVERYGEVDIKTRLWRCTADRIMTRARSLCERVEETAHKTAGRLRMMVEALWQVRAEKIVQRARQDVRIDGRKIDLG